MCASRANGEKLRASPGHENWFAKGVPQKHSFIRHVVDLAAFFEIRAFDIVGRFSHRNFLRSIKLKSH